MPELKKVMISAPSVRHGRSVMGVNTWLVERLRTRMAEPDKLPLYVKFADVVQLAVRNGEIQRGDFLPSERDFVLALGISRITVRKALELLAELEIVVRGRGYGTYVNQQLEYRLKPAMGFSQQVVATGKTPGTLWISKTRVPCRAEIAEHLQLSAGCDVYLLKRVRDIDGEPVSVEENYVPLHLIADVEQIDISLYAYFRSQGIAPVRTRNWVSAQSPSQEFIQCVNTPATLPVLVVKSLAFDTNQRPLDYSINYCRADMYVFYSED